MAGLRAVADTNVWVAAAVAPNGVCGELLRAAIDQRWQPVISPLLLAELEEVLARPRFRRWLTHAEAARLVTGLRHIAEVVDDPPPDAIRRTRDPDDEFLLALAIAAGAEVLVSGDADLLDAVDVDIPVVTPSSFLALLDTGA